MVTQNFATSGSSVFLTGVACDDADLDDFYSVGEGFANVQYSIGGNSTVTAASGGFALATAAVAGLTDTTGLDAHITII